MIAEVPDILALDFDGVLCEGMREYFDTSRRTYTRMWPEATEPDDNAFSAFRALRPVILTGWEMPVLLKAIVQGREADAITHDWVSVRDAIVRADGRPAETLVKTLGHTLDEVRREWIAADLAGWLERNVPYCDLDEVRRLVAEPSRSVLVTTKEGEFARLILESWKVSMASIQGKEAGTHKCENLRSLIDGPLRSPRASPTSVVCRGSARDAPACHHPLRPLGRRTLPGCLGLQHTGGKGLAEPGRSHSPARARPVPPRSGQLADGLTSYTPGSWSGILPKSARRLTTNSTRRAGVTAM